MHSFLCAFALIAMLGSFARAASAPNLVLILADDLGYGSVGCYGANPELIRTPHIDRLAREGRRFTDANTTSSVCSPTRYSVLTGRYAWRTRLQKGVLNVHDPLLIETNRLTLASLLKQRGYTSAAIGKWHLGYGTAARMDFTGTLRPGPREIGFDHHFGVPSNHGDVTGIFVENHHVHGLRSTNLAAKGIAGTNFNGAPYLGLDAPQRKDEETMSRLTAEAVNWLHHQSASQPFFLYFTPVAVHNPITPSERTRGGSKASAFGDWVHELDQSVGQILAALDSTRLASNTIVLFTSDNGGVSHPKPGTPQTLAMEAGLKPNGLWRGGKDDIWEGGFRVPYLLRWPGRVSAGTTCDETLSLVDTLATVAAVVAAELPAPSRAGEDSFNMLPAWLGEKYASPLRPHLIVHSADGVFAIRQGSWKWIEGQLPKGSEPVRARAEQFHPQLYQLTRDLAETRDVTPEQPETQAGLMVLLKQQREQGFSALRPARPH